MLTKRPSLLRHPITILLCQPSLTFAPLPTRPIALRTARPKLPNCTWVHSFFAGVDALAPFIQAKLLEGAGASIPLTNGKGAFSDSLAEWVRLHAEMIQKAHCPTGIYMTRANVNAA